MPYYGQTVTRTALTFCDGLLRKNLFDEVNWSSKPMRLVAASLTTGSEPSENQVSFYVAEDEMNLRVARSMVTMSSGVFAPVPSLAGWYSRRNRDADTTMRI